MKMMSRDTHHPIGKTTDALTAELVAGLEPVRPLGFYTGLGVALFGLGATVIIVALFFGIRPDIRAALFDPVFLLPTGLFLLLGLASSVAVIIMSRPRVGGHHDGWLWAIAMATLLPVTAAFIGTGRGASTFQAPALAHGFDCLMVGSSLGLLTFGTLVMWLRRGAPTSTARAGLLIGIAAGSFGIFSFSFHCIYSDIVHIGLWHSAVIVLSAVFGRIAVPRLIRW